MNQKEDVILPHRYTHISNFTKTLLRVKCPDEGYGIIDRSFRVVLPCKYKRLESVQGPNANALFPSKDRPIRTFYLKKNDGDTLFSFIDTLGNVLSKSVFHSPETLRVYDDVVLDDLSGGIQAGFARDFRLKDMLGNEILSDSIVTASVVYSATGQSLFEVGKRFLWIRDRSKKCALFNLDSKVLVTDYEYDFISLLPTKQNDDPKFVVGKIGEDLYLVALDGKKIVPTPFETIAMGNNFNRGPLQGLVFDDSDVEAFMKTVEGDYYLMRDDLSVERISK